MRKLASAALVVAALALAPAQASHAPRTVNGRILAPSATVPRGSSHGRRAARGCSWALRPRECRVT